MKQSLNVAGLACLLAFGVSNPCYGQVVISGYLSNAAGSDGNFEYVQLVATQSINFASTPFSVVVNNNGTAAAAGWAAGGGSTYGFNITSGTVNPGDVFYIGGSGLLINGNGSASIASLNFLRTINTNTTAGDDGLGNFSTSGVIGNGGNNADGIAVFSGLAGNLTADTVPVDAIFFGTGIGTAAIASGGYQLPVNDWYSGGKLTSSSHLYAGDIPAQGGFVRFEGTFDVPSQTWTTARTSQNILAPTEISQINSVLVVPEPATVLGASVLALGGLALLRRRRTINA